VIDLNLKELPIDEEELPKRLKGAWILERKSSSGVDAAREGFVDLLRKLQSGVKRVVTPVAEKVSLLDVDKFVPTDVDTTSPLEMGELFAVAAVAADVAANVTADTVGLKRPTNETVRAFLQVLEDSAKKELPERKPPVLVIREVQRLVGGAPAIFKELFINFEPRKEGQSIMPVIIESSKFLASNTLSFLVTSRESFRLYLVTE